MDRFIWKTMMNTDAQKPLSWRNEHVGLAWRLAKKESFWRKSASLQKKEEV